MAGASFDRLRNSLAWVHCPLSVSHLFRARYLGRMASATPSTSRARHALSQRPIAVPSTRRLPAASSTRTGMPAWVHRQGWAGVSRPASIELCSIAAQCSSWRSCPKLQESCCCGCCGSPGVKRGQWRGLRCRHQQQPQAPTPTSSLPQAAGAEHAEPATLQQATQSKCFIMGGPHCNHWLWPCRKAVMSTHHVEACGPAVCGPACSPG